MFGIEKNKSRTLVFDVDGVQVTKVEFGHAVLTEVARSGDADPGVVAQAMTYAPAYAKVTGQLIVGETESPDDSFIVDLLLKEGQGDK